MRSIARSWFLFILAGTLLGAVIGLGFAIVTPPSYTSTVKLLITPAPKDTGITNGDLQIAQALAPTFAELAVTRPILDQAIASIGVDMDATDLANAISTHVPVGTSLLEISVSGQDAPLATGLANAIAEQLSAYASAPACPGPSCATASSPNAGLTVSLAVVDPATVPKDQDGPGALVSMMVGAAIALFLTISLAFLVESAWPSASRGGPQARPSELVSEEWAQASPGSSPDTSKARAADARRATATTIGQDPFESRAKGPGSRIAARGVINDLELEKGRRPD